MEKACAMIGRSVKIGGTALGSVGNVVAGPMLLVTVDVDIVELRLEESRTSAKAFVEDDGGCRTRSAHLLLRQATLGACLGPIATQQELDLIPQLKRA